MMLKTRDQTPKALSPILRTMYGDRNRPLTSMMLTASRFQTTLVRKLLPPLGGAALVRLTIRSIGKLMKSDEFITFHQRRQEYLERGRHDLHFRHGGAGRQFRHREYGVGHI